MTKDRRNAFMWRWSLVSNAAIVGCCIGGVVSCIFCGIVGFRADGLVGSFISACGGGFIGCIAGSLIGSLVGVLVNAIKYLYFLAYWRASVSGPSLNRKMRK
jgi:hypothetical protein